jgi:hypothetical protein
LSNRRALARHNVATRLKNGKADLALPAAKFQNIGSFARRGVRSEASQRVQTSTSNRLIAVGAASTPPSSSTT